MSSSHRKRRNIRLLLTARGVRAFGDGFVSILVPVYLTGIGFGAFEEFGIGHGFTPVSEALILKLIVTCSF